MVTQVPGGINFASPYADEFTASDQYARRFVGDAGAWLLETQNKIMRDLLFRLSTDKGEALSVLDVGGGHGQVAALLPLGSIQRLVVHGSSEDCGKQVARLLPEGRCEFQVGDPLKLPFGDSSFDLVTCLRFVSHVEEWQRIISELCRVTNRAVIIDFPALLSFNLCYPLLFRIKKMLEGNTRTFSIFRRREIEAHFASHGFVLRSHAPQFFWPMVVHRVLKNVALSTILEEVPRRLGLTYLLGSPVISLFTRM